MSADVNVRSQRKAANLLRLLSDLNSRMEVGQAQVLMEVATNPGCTMSDIERRTGLSQSAVSRNILAMSEYKRVGEPGYNFVETVKDPREPRRYIVFLKPEGKAFVTKLVRTIEPSFSIDRDTDARVEVSRVHEEAAAAAAEEKKERKKMVDARRSLAKR